jgi:hypothetical protein
MVSPTEAVIDGSGPPLSGIAQTSGPTVKSAAKGRVDNERVSKERIFMAFACVQKPRCLV